MTFWNTKAGGYLVLAGVGALALWYLGRKGAEAAGAVATAVNPLNPGNVAYGGVNTVGEAITGDPYWTLGGAFYDLTHPEPGKSLLDLVNPASSGNAAYGGVNAAGAAASGDPYWTLGGWFYDITH